MCHDDVRFSEGGRFTVTYLYIFTVQTVLLQLIFYRLCITEKVVSTASLYFYAKLGSWLCVSLHWSGLLKLTTDVIIAGYSCLRMTTMITCWIIHLFSLCLEAFLYFQTKKNKTLQMFIKPRTFFHTAYHTQIHLMHSTL